MENELVMTTSITLAIMIGVVTITRELWLWYYKINERIELTKETNELLKKLIELSGGEAKTETVLIRNVEVPPYLEQEAEQMAKRLQKGERIVYDIAAKAVVKVGEENTATDFNNTEKYKVLFEK